MARAQQHIDNKGFPIVGIGASAGGLEAFSQLLEHLPANTGMAFVLVQHLDPTHESKLTELLARTTPLPVTEVRHRMPVKPDHVYVIPPNTNMVLEGRLLKLRPRAKARTVNLPVNTFFQSLAEQCGSKAIGVVLSGTATDGGEGIRAIKVAGGITFAQDEKTAKYGGMPRTAIGTGCVDFILSPGAIAVELISISRHPYIKHLPAARRAPDPGLDQDGALPKIFGHLRDVSGVDFTHYKPNTIHRRILRRMAMHKLHKLAEYVQYLRTHPGEAEKLYEDLLINVTGFFRDPAVFQTLKKKILPRLVNGLSSENSIRVWVAGCSTGEEAYSLAILLLEYLGDKNQQPHLQVFATDISEQALEMARAGNYPKSIESAVSAGRLRRFFVKTQTGYQISKAVRELCIFAKQNVVKDPPFSNLDLISCRNVMIYLSAPLQKRLLPIFHYALKPKGCLLLGSSESITGSESLFAVADKKQRIFFKKLAATRSYLDFGLRDDLSEKPENPPKTDKPVRGTLDVNREADRLLLGRYAPASVLINNDLEMVQFRGRTGAYLEPAAGTASLNLLKMAREGLEIDLRTAIKRARRQGTTVRKQGARVRSNGGFREVTLEVIPLKITGQLEQHFLVLFEEPGPKPAFAPAEEHPAAPLSKTAADREIVRLEQELTATKEYMRSIVEEFEGANEELKAANEEIQSSNEELQSTNEELETAKEELQSTNEELTTVNEELQGRNLELSHLNNDLANLLASINIPIIMLGPDLRVRRITPAAEKILHLHQADLGRSITSLRLPVEPAVLEQMLNDAIDSLMVKDCEVCDQQGHWYSLRVRPYRTDDNKIDGAVLAFLDIDVLKQSFKQTEYLRQFSEAIVETIRKPLLVLEGDLRVRSANSAYCKLFEESRENVEKHYLYELGKGQWNIPALRRVLNEVLPQHSVFENFEVTQDFPRIGQRTIMLNARQLKRDGNTENLILLAMEDITERLRLEKSVLDISEQERERMGRDLHDGLSQQLTGIAFMAETLVKRLKTQAPDVAAGLNKIVGHIKESVGLTHDLARGLFPVQLKNEGIVPALQALAANIASMFNVECDVHCPAPVEIHDETVARHLYRIAQEAVYNAVKHSRGSHVRLDLARKDGTISMTVSDNGNGFDQKVLKTTDMGLHIMNYRARIIGATLEITSRPRKGTKVICSLKKSPL